MNTIWAGAQCIPGNKKRRQKESGGEAIWDRKKTWLDNEGLSVENKSTTTVKNRQRKTNRYGRRETDIPVTRPLASARGGLSESENEKGNNLKLNSRRTLKAL